jgi:hypothetical protein
MPVQLVVKQHPWYQGSIDLTLIISQDILNYSDPSHQPGWKFGTDIVNSELISWNLMVLSSAHS